MPRWSVSRHVFGLLVALLAQLPALRWAQNLGSVCGHENYPQVEASTEITDGQQMYRNIRVNQTHRYFHRNYDIRTMNQPDQYRKLIINLEPCRGIVYLFVRKTRRCYPDPYSCIDLTPGREERRPTQCRWAHFWSEIDGSRDGTPTLFEVPLSSTRYFISVFAVTNAAYTLTVLADIGAFPRPGGNGRITAQQLSEMRVQISWDEAGYVPAGRTSTRQYKIYSSMLLESDNRTNMAVFMRPDKIMNTVCGLENNTDRAYANMSSAMCSRGICNATIDGVITDKRYVFNVVVESGLGFSMAYSGLIMRTDWEVVRQAASDATLKVIGAVSGSVLAMVVIIYFMMLKLYG